MKNPGELSCQEFRAEAERIHTILREADKKRGINGYRVLSRARNAYLAFEAKPSLRTLRYCVMPEYACIFSARFEVLPWYAVPEGDWNCTLYISSVSEEPVILVKQNNGLTAAEKRNLLCSWGNGGKATI